MGFRRALLVSALLLASAACGGQGGDPGTTPLLDGSHTPDVLTESRAIDLPPSPSGNRFLRGWTPWRSPQGLRLTPIGRTARIEGVNLGNRERNLVLIAALGAAVPASTLTVRFGGSAQSVEVPVAARIEIPLPTDLPLGRFPIDLELGEGEWPSFERAAFSRALPAGTARTEDSDLFQTGESLVEITRPVDDGMTLVGRFSPPASPEDDQKFRLIVEREDGSSVEAFSWKASHPGLLSRERKIALQLGGRGWMRARLLATGGGSAARWSGLGLRGTPPEVEVPTAALPAPPRIVIFYIMDALRADHVGHLGGPEGITPTLDRLAAEGATFLDHLSVAPNTAPSMKTLFTGQMFLIGGGWKLPRDGARTLSERFREAGYNTGLLTGNGNLSAWRGLTRGFDYKPRRLHFERAAQHSAGTYNDNAEQLHEATLEWLDRLGPDQRALVHIQTVHPHNPYDPPEPFRSRHTHGIDSSIDGETETLLDIKHLRTPITAADRERLRGLYAGAVAYNDAELARFLEQILERYPPEEVLLVFSSDHGEELFEHGGVLHGYTLYEEMLRVPLIFWWPGRIQPRRIDAATDSLDLHRTLAELVEPASGDLGGGRSLWPLVLGKDARGKELRFAAASSVDGGIFMIRSDRYKLVWAPRTGDRWGQGQGLGRQRDPEYLFDLRDDPAEQVNLAGEDLLEAAWLRARLRSWIELGLRLEQGEPPAEMDDETRRSLRALGYLQ